MTLCLARPEIFGLKIFGWRAQAALLARLVGEWEWGMGEWEWGMGMGSGEWEWGQGTKIKYGQIGLVIYGFFWVFGKQPQNPS